MAKITLIDNYDSFTYNLVHYLGELGSEVNVYRNDARTVKQDPRRKTGRAGHFPWSLHTR